jgi:hypothetical protein
MAHPETIHSLLTTGGLIVSVIKSRHLTAPLRPVPTTKLLHSSDTICGNCSASDIDLIPQSAENNCPSQTSNNCDAARGPYSVFSLAGIGMGHGLDGRGWLLGSEKLIFSCPQRPCRRWGRTSLYLMDTEGSFLLGKGAGTWNRPLTSIYCQGQEWWSDTSTPSYVFMTRCLMKTRDLCSLKEWQGSCTLRILQQISWRR